LRNSTDEAELVRRVDATLLCNQLRYQLDQVRRGRLGGNTKGDLRASQLEESLELNVRRLEGALERGKIARNRGLAWSESMAQQVDFTACDADSVAEIMGRGGSFQRSPEDLFTILTGKGLHGMLPPEHEQIRLQPRRVSSAEHWSNDHTGDPILPLCASVRRYAAYRARSGAGRHLTGSPPWFCSLAQSRSCWQ
jgi:hypothetical protein